MKDNASRKLTIHLVAIALVWVGLASALNADEKSQALIVRGAAELGRNRFAEALVLFQQAVQADPKDGDAYFLSGLALNRLGRHSEALASLQQAEKLKTQYRDLYFELGWAHLFLREYQRAIDLLTHYESIKPGRGLAQELLGRAYLALNQDEKAEAAMREALRRDPRLAPTANYYLAVIALRRGEREKAAKALQDLAQQQRGTAVGQSASDLLDQQRLGERRWNLGFSLQGGYDSNVIRLGDRTAVPPGLSRRDAGSTQLSLGGSYDLVRGDTDNLRALYDFSASFYHGISDFDTLDHRFSLLYRHSFSNLLAANLAMDHHYGEIGRRPLSYDFTLSPSLEVRLTDWLTVGIPYSVTISKDYLSVARPLDRTGNAHSLGFGFSLPSLPGGLRARLGYNHTWNRTDGSDYDFQSNSILVGLNLPLPWQTTLDTSYTRIFERYDNLNSLSGFTLRRRDDVDIVRVQFVKSLTPHWFVRLAYDFVRDDTNLRIFNYHRHVGTAGVIFRY